MPFAALAGSPSQALTRQLSQRESLWRNRTLCTSAGNLQSRKTPLPSAHYVRSHLPQGDGFRGGGKVSGIAQRRPLGGAGFAQQRLRGVFPQRRAFTESGAVNAAHRYDPSREKAILENPQIFQNCEIINNISADDAQSEAERILNRPAAPLRIKIAIPAAWCYTTYKGRGLAACALCRKI